MGNADPTESKALFSVLAAPVLIFDVVAVFLFYLGWTYIYYLYYNFSVNVHALNIPLSYFFVYALPVIYMNKGSLLFAFAVLFLVLILIRALTPRIQSKYPWLTERLTPGAITVFLIILLGLSDSLAQETAKETAADLRSGNAKTIRFSFKEDPTGLYPQEFIDANKMERLKLLAQTKDRFIVFYQPDSGDKVLPLGLTYVVFNSDVQLASIEIENIHRKE